MRPRRATAPLRAGLLRSVVAVVLGISGRRDLAPVRPRSRDRAPAPLEAPMAADNPLQFGRAYQLPPFGRGNGLDALFWTPAERLPADRVDAVLQALRRADIPGWVAPVRAPGVGHRSAASPHDLWAAADRFDEAQDIVMRVLAGR